MSHRWQPLPILLVTAGVLLVFVAAGCNASALGWWQILIYAGGALALAAAFWFRRELSAAEVELEAQRRQLTTDTTRLGDDRQQLEKLNAAIEKQFAEQGARLDQREKSLAARFLTYHEWTEFPQPLDLRQPGSQLPGLSAHDPRLHGPTDQQLGDLVKKDRQVLELLKAETKILYDNILSNRYSQDGKVQLQVLRDDAYLLMTRVARIYQPAAEHPLLETSVALVIRAASRACLHFLVVLDELPLKVHDYSVSSLYQYVRGAVDAYRVYKSTEPYWPYVNAAYYLGRFAMGMNPLSLGAWWFVGQMSKHGAQALATQVVNRQALALLSDVIRVIGFEVAGIFGGDFRYRDPNWIYAAELSELVSCFPLSRESLSHAFREVGSLQLRSEYDRVFLYRCLAAHTSARPGNYHAAQTLTMEERRAIAGRLEKFLAAFLHGKTPDRVQKWKQDVELRLNVKLLVAAQPTAHSVKAQLQDAVRSLASFLLGVKEFEPLALAELLAGTRLLAEFSQPDRAALLGQLLVDSPFFFEHPDLDPDSDLVLKYLEDLAALHVRTRPRHAQIEETLVDVAQYLRQEPRVMRGILQKQYAAQLAELLPADSPHRKAPPAAARAILDLLEPGEKPKFLYQGITVEWPAGVAGPTYAKQLLWLLGKETRLVLFVSDNQPKLLWCGERPARSDANDPVPLAGDDPVRLQAERGYLISACKLNGGKWLDGETLPPPTIRISGPLVSSYAAYFGPLELFVHDASEPGASEPKS